MGARHEDVGGLQDGVAEQVVGHLLHAGGGGHVLDRGQLLQAFDCDHAAEDEVHFVDLVHGRLEVEGCLLRVDADRQVVEHDVARVLADLGDVLLGRFGRQHVKVGDDEEAFVLFLECEAVLQAADVVAEMQFAGGTVAGEDSSLGCHGLLPRVQGLVRRVIRAHCSVSKSLFGALDCG